MTSPFSLSLGWRVEWNRVRVKPREVILPPEIRPLMYAVASIGVIGSVQIKQLFGLEDRKELKQLCKGQKLYHVFVARDDVYDLLLYMKWNRNPEQRIIVVAEKLEYLSPSNPFLADFKVRATTDEDLTRENGIDQMFYEWDEANIVWIKHESIYKK